MNDSNSALTQLCKRFICSSIFLCATIACFIIPGCATHPKPIAQETWKLKETAPDVETKNESQTKFGIFLTENANPFLDVRPGHTDIASLKLASIPVISEMDIISYDFSTHSMKLRHNARARISLSAVELVRGIPFVVVANGQRIYLGTFKTDISSIPSEVPSIVYRFQQPADIEIIDRAYPTDKSSQGPDPRSDPRIKSALASLHKLQ